MWKQKLKNAETNKVYIGIGSNVGNRLLNFKKTIKLISENENISDVKISSVYETLPYGNIEQNNFYNAVINFNTNFTLQELFDFTKSVEKKIGRIKRQNWGPREIDLDILLFNKLVFADENISIPHKDLVNRDFVLVPLLELSKNLVNPATKIKLKEYLNKLSHKFIISKFGLEI
ncbi:MAG: 2-amino-4-hydroxy-6-hydroxymethyldihydropteridine diphosphokinase [Ignavibacteriae bacterium]|nr:2-amino-4-hydroxy-6-hydroxymethyldihydropteridine diphosphokinase [Ignavibacteriota bacterium]